MQNILSLKKEFILLITGLLLVILAMNSSYIQTMVSNRSSNAIAVKPTPTPDPSLDINSLNNSISYALPVSWKKVDHIDPSGINTYLKLTSPDFNSSTPGVIDSGVGVVIGRVYDLKADESVRSKLSASYGLETYNVTPLKIGGQNAMTMHKDGASINARIIYVATKTHLWDITITSKSLEDAQKYQGEIDAFLNSIKFN